MQEITVQELKQRQANGGNLNIIDVREEWEFDEDNIGAQLLPLGDLPKRLSEITHLKDEEVIVHCRSGARSARAQKYLMSQGFSNVINLAGGIMAYREDA
ncbi:rhodanese-like domain-containing protein [Roseivirga sp. E12]|uniref:rhodanese-like domain-containing protein n=1 Tax=Roseivirga sp. E12 TaxID=2819237 RepID=UPI001ABCA279|nr:rhodanese-like domain-containing protein [Roseivirga sp. E12]MBO3697881.1 rhodanese-like domain-containing protein [Roseivirga sp. E12]